MTQALVLSLFPGIGLLDRAFEEEGFCVVRGPDLLWGGDVKRFHPPAGKFDGVIGGPPCKRWSRLAHMVKANGYELAPDLIPEFERVVYQARPSWFLMENVEAAPTPAPGGYYVDDVLLNNRWFGGEQNRKRRFSFGSLAIMRRDIRPCILVDALLPLACEQAVMASGGGRPVPVAMIRDSAGKHRRKTSILKNFGYQSAAGLVRAKALQGLPADFLDDAPFTMSGKFEAIGNGVPLPLGRAVAQAVKRAMGYELTEQSA
jgi:DNA (cytosine-5)-methyltransferase 1